MICDFGFDWGFVRFCPKECSEDILRVLVDFEIR